MNFATYGNSSTILNLDACFSPVVYHDEPPAAPKRAASEPAVEKSAAPLQAETSAPTEAPAPKEPEPVAPEVVKPLEDKTVKVGKMVKIGFELKPGSPAPKIEWFKDGSSVSGDEGTVDFII